jgi:hypothetical protein
MLNSNLFNGFSYHAPPSEVRVGAEVSDLVDRSSYTLSLPLPVTDKKADVLFVQTFFKASTSIYMGADTLGGSDLGTTLGWPGTNTGCVYLSAAGLLRVDDDTTTHLSYVMPWSVVGCTGMVARLVGVYDMEVGGHNFSTFTGTLTSLLSIGGTGSLGGTSTAKYLVAGTHILLQSNAPVSNAAHVWTVTGTAYGAVTFTPLVNQNFESTVGRRYSALLRIPVTDTYVFSMSRASGTDYLSGGAFQFNGVTGMPEGA